MENDARILQATADELRRLGHAVEILDEAKLNGQPASPTIFAMCQSSRGIEWLESMRERGKLVINSPQGIRNCYRVNLVRIAAEQSLPFPRSVLVPADLPIGEVPETMWSEAGLWVKRGDAHALEKSDVVRVASPSQLAEALRDFRTRGIRHAVLQSHVEGCVIKFYGVRQTGFFRRFAERPPEPVDVDEPRMRQLAERAAEALGLEVYGGDVVLTPSGEMVLIDVNDWPSFGRCRDEAAQHIARRILQCALSERTGTHEVCQDPDRDSRARVDSLP